MRASKNQIVLLFLQDPDPISITQLGYRWEKLFGEQNRKGFLNPALRELVSEEVLGEFDIEFSGAFDFASADHNSHGEIDLSELQNFFNLTELLGLSKGAVKFVYENALALADEAKRLGLDEALKTIMKLPVDSSAWTGATKGFRFTDENRLDLLKMLSDAELALDRSSLTNSEIGQGKGLIKAAIVLLNVPDPPEQDIWSILNRGATIATLASFFIGIVKYLESLK